MVSLLAQMLVRLFRYFQSQWLSGSASQGLQGRARVVSCPGRSESQRVEGLLQRIADAPLAEERQDAVSELRDALHGNPEVRQHVIVLETSGAPAQLHVHAFISM